MYIETLATFRKTLSNLDGWLNKAVAHAERGPYDVANLLSARLYPDMFHFTRQVQAACDAAKFAAARTTGREPPKHPDTETTVEELRARVAAVVAFLDTFSAEDFAGAEERIVPLGFLPGKGLSAADYFHQLATPNFYFHVSMAYALLRHNGVDVGKADYIGHLPLRDL